MHPFGRLLLLILFTVSTGPLLAQMPFYTDNADVTDQGTLHFEIYNEYDGLQSAQYPDLRQNTANFKVNYGLPHRLELDFDIPYLTIYRAPGSENTQPETAMPTWASSGTSANPPGRSAIRTSRPACTSSSQPAMQQQNLGSGLTDYWLNLIAQEPFTDKTRLNANFGFVFAGNTSTGVLGIQTIRGHVYTGGLSLAARLQPACNPRGGTLWRHRRQRRPGQRPVARPRWRPVPAQPSNGRHLRRAGRQPYRQSSDRRPGRLRGGLPSRPALDGNQPHF